MAWHRRHNQNGTMALTDGSRETSYLGVLEPPGDDEALAALIADGTPADEFHVEPLDDLPDLLHRVESDDLAAVVVAPEFPDGWPASVAKDVIDAVAGRVPLIVVCRSTHDAAVLANREPRDVVVLLRERTTPSELARVLRGELSRRRASP